MSIPQHIILEFQKKALKVFSPLACEYNLELVQKDELTFCLVGHTVEVRLYLYPSHVPLVTITLMPMGEQWKKWRQESIWGTTGIWLAHLVAFRKTKAQCPDMHFGSVQELSNHIESLVRVLCDVGSDLLRGDATDLQQLVAYVDEMVQKKNLTLKDGP